MAGRGALHTEHVGQPEKGRERGRGREGGRRKEDGDGGWRMEEVQPVCVSWV
jgi:hypothetical protein